MRDASKDSNAHQDNVRKVQTDGAVPEKLSKATKQRSAPIDITLIDGISNAAARGETLSVPAEPAWQ